MNRHEFSPSDVACILGVHPSTVRRWEKRGILTPARRLPGSGYRRYDPADVNDLRIKILSGSTE